jgi:hypothetical protein
MGGIPLSIGQMVKVDAAGHLLQLERPNEVACEILQFVDGPTDGRQEGSRILLLTESVM